MISEAWRQIAIELYAAGGMRPYEVHKKLTEELGYSLTKDQVRGVIRRFKEKLESAEVTYKLATDEKRITLQNQEPNRVDSKWDGTQTIKFALISDTHIGSKYTQLTYLHDFYDLCVKQGVTDIYHSGDLTEGLRMRLGHEYELYEVSADDMRDDVIKNYPMRPGVTTHFITGNHDASIYKQVGYDIGQAIANARPDMNYLGRDCAVVNLTPNCPMELRHPWDGMSYAMSYRPQKMIEAMESDSKPKILVIGHYHKAFYLFYRNVHCFLGGCFQAQTPFERGKGISVHLGGWIVELEVDSEGTVQAIKPQFVPFYNSVKDDWKKWK